MSSPLRLFVTSALIWSNLLVHAQTFLLEISFPGCNAEQLTSISIQNEAGVETMSATGYPNEATCAFVQLLSTPALADGIYTITITSMCSNAVIHEVDSFVVVNGVIPAGHSATYPCSGGTPLDCLGLVNGPNMPGTPCDDGLASTSFDTWLPNCLCIGIPDSTTYTDCAGITNGPNVPGQACDDGDPNTTGETWNWDCECVVPGVTPCSAGMLYVQAYGQDSVAIPNEVWVINTSTGGTEPYTVFWNFDDGTTSTEPYPVHVYATNGMYIPCLTITDAMGCEDTYCDTLVLDEDGFYNGFVMEQRPGQLRNGFTLRVIEQLPTGIASPAGTSRLTISPNPAARNSTVTLRGPSAGPAQCSLIDQHGSVVLEHLVNAGLENSPVVLHLKELPAGIYLLVVRQGTERWTQRLVVQ
jgi:hypothetical protein